MIAIYLLVTVFIQLSPYNLVASIGTAPEQVVVQLSEVHDLKVGSPVVLDGKLVGSIERIAPKVAEPNYEVLLEINAISHAQLREGTVAIVTALVGQLQSATILELIVPDDSGHRPLQPGTRLIGYPSFSDLWQADGGVVS